MKRIWCVIPAARQHRGLLAETIEVTGLPRDHVLVVANGDHPPTELETNTPVLRDPSKVINISRWWNLGLDWIEQTETRRDGSIDEHHVLIPNADARIGLHRPSLGDPRRDTLVTTMSEQLAQYAEDMGVSRRIVDDMLAIPASRVRFVTAAQLAQYGLSVSLAP